MTMQTPFLKVLKKLKQVFAVYSSLKDQQLTTLYGFHHELLPWIYLKFSKVSLSKQRRPIGLGYFNTSLEGAISRCSSK